jgi:hypothetical protein
MSTQAFFRECLDFLDDKPSAEQNFLQLINQLGHEECEQIARFVQLRADRLLTLLLVLPDALCWEIACSFTKHVLPIWDTRRPKDDRPHQIVRARLEHTSGTASSEELGLANHQALKVLADVSNDMPLLCVAGAVFACVSIRRKSSHAAWSAAEHSRAATAWAVPDALHSEHFRLQAEHGEQEWQNAFVRDVILRNS